MKKSILFFAGLFLLSLFVSCDRHISPDKLPQQAKAFLTQYFPGNNVISVERDGLKYDVILMDGTSLEFSHSGDWTDVDCQFLPVPAGIAPAPIQSYVEANFNLYYITKIKKDRREYEVELNNDLDLKFDRNGMFMYAD